MKFPYLIPFGIASAMLIACGDDSGVTVPEGVPGEGSVDSSSSIMPGDITSSTNLDPYDTSLVKTPPDLIESSSSNVLPVSSANITPGGNGESADTEEDDVVALDGSETTIIFNATDATVTNDNGCLEKAANAITIKCSGNYYLQGSATDF